MMNISIILPTINEADNLKLLIPEIINNLETVENLNFEIIVSDDGSTDSTWQEILKCSKPMPEKAFLLISVCFLLSNDP